MNKKFRKRIQALLMAVVISVVTIGSVTTVAAQSEMTVKSFIDFSFPFDFLFFRTDIETEDMSEEEISVKRDMIREQSMKAEKAAGLKFVYQYTMETPESLSTLDLSGCIGDGTFAFAEPEFIPEKGVSVCEFVFTPEDADAYEYDLMLGWDEKSQTLRRYVEIICNSLIALEEEVKDSEETVIPEAIETTPEVTPIPDVTEVPTPEDTEGSESVPTPEIPENVPPAEIPETPEDVPSAEMPETPEVPLLPDTEVLPDDNTFTPGSNLIPEITTIPELMKPEITPEVTPTPEPIVTAPLNPGTSVENGVQIIVKDDIVKSFEAKVSDASVSPSADEQIQMALALTKEYNALTDKQQNAVSSDVLSKLASFQEMASTANHTNNGVTVSGNVPWFVQLRVTIGNDTDTYVPTGLDTIVPYEMSLWNLMTESEYILSGGEKVTLTMAVPENIHLYDGLTIVHYMDETHYEYIELKIDGNTMSFETASFSPFNVAGSTVLVGGKPGNSSGGSQNETTDEKPVNPTTNPSSGNNAGITKPSGSSNSNTKKPSGTAGNNSAGTINKPVSDSPVKTGDTASINQYFMLCMGAVIMMILCVMLMRSTDKEERYEL